MDHIQNSDKSDPTGNPETRVLFNGDCPVCSFEIGHYASYAGRNDLAVRFEDLNTAETESWGLTRDQAARRLYVMKDGQIFGGIDGFLVLWSDMPRYRWLARVIGVPGIRHVASFVYDYILAPAIYAWDRHRQRKKPTA